MKSRLLIAFFLTNMCHGLAQNYQGLRSNQISYYGNEELSYILATRTDSVKLDGLDSVFYSFQTIRQNPGSLLPDCSFIRGANWYGEKVIIRPDGEHVFFNKDLDSIFIQSLANLNDTFRVYTYPDLYDTIYGWISDYDTIDVLGDVDTVKIIALYHSSGLPLITDTISISKNHGFLKWFAPWSYPDIYIGPLGELISGSTNNFELAGTEFPRVGITKPLIGEVYDFEINNRFVFSNTYEESGINWSEEYIERTILDKTIGVNEVTYLIHDTIRFHTVDFIGGGNTTTYSGSTYPVTYSNPDQWFNPYMPEEFTSSEPDMKWVSLHLNECGLITETRNNRLLYNTDLTYPDCFTDATLSSYFYLSTDYVLGAGNLEEEGLYIIDGGSQQLDSDILYYAKADDSCGMNSVLQAVHFESEKNEPFLYPNPAREFVTVKLRSHDIIRIQLLDVSGKIIMTKSNLDENPELQYDLSLEGLTPGVYFVVVDSGQSRQILKLVCN